jgi:DNA-binding CsgD family transcriptional regulator
LHLKNARKKLGAETREQAIAIALLNGLISP